MAESRSENPGREGNPWQFLGVDLSQWPRLWLEGWRAALASGWLGRIVPAESVDVTLPSGECRRYLAGDWSACGTTASRYRAVLLDQHDVLTRSLTLPPLSGDDLALAVGFEVEGLTPFGIDHTAWGYRKVAAGAADAPVAASGEVVVEVALARQADVESHLLHASASAAEHEVWALGSAEQPVVFRGFAEKRRSRRRTRRLLQIGVLVIAAMLLSLAALAVPAIDAQWRLHEANAAHAQLQDRVEDVQTARSQLTLLSEAALSVSDRLAAAAVPIRLVDRFSALLPQTAYLEQLTMDGRHFRVTGQSDNASALLQRLGNEPGFDNVRAPSAFTRSRATGKDRFVIEFDYRPELAETAADEARP